MPDRFKNLINHQKKGAMKRFFVKFGRALNWNLTPVMKPQVATGYAQGFHLFDSLLSGVDPMFLYMVLML